MKKLLNSQVIPWTIIVILTISSFLGIYKVRGSHLVGLLTYLTFLTLFVIQLFYSFKFFKTSKRLLIIRLITIYSILYSFTAFTFVCLNLPGGTDLIALNKSQSIVLVIIVSAILLTNKQKKMIFKEMKTLIMIALLGIILSFLVYYLVDIESLVSQETFNRFIK